MGFLLSPRDQSRLSYAKITIKLNIKKGELSRFSISLGNKKCLSKKEDPMAPRPQRVMQPLQSLIWFPSQIPFLQLRVQE
jgi:hypothetical protein